MIRNLWGLTKIFLGYIFADGKLSISLPCSSTVSGNNDDNNDNSNGDEDDVVVGPLSGNGGNSWSHIF